MANTHSSPSNYRLSIIQAIGIAIVAIVIFALVVAIFGQVEGSEFNPDSFTRRSYRFFRIPLLGWQVTPVVHKDITNSLEQQITTDLSLPAASPDSKHWDLVDMNWHPQRVFQGDAKILCDYLDTQQEGKLYWEDWSEENSKKADVLWDVIAEVAQARLYLLIPELFHLAQKTESPEELRRRANEFVVSEAIELSELFHRREQPDQAAAAIRLALSIDPDSPEARSANEINQDDV